MRIWDSMCATLLSTGARRGAMMATLPCDHPDIEEFVSAKQDNRELRHFNMSVQVTDDLWRRYAAMVSGLVFPVAELGDDAGNAAPVLCRVLRRLRAHTLWDKLMRATYDYVAPA